MVISFCDHPEKSISISWVNKKTGYNSTGPICNACAAKLCEGLKQYPGAHETITITPTPQEAEALIPL